MPTTTEQLERDTIPAAADRPRIVRTEGPVAGSAPAPNTPVAARTSPPEASRFLTIVNAVAWVGFVSLVFAVAPAADPEAASIGLVGLIVSQVFWLSALGAAIGLMTRAPVAFVLTAIGGVALLGGAVDCFGAGHTESWVFVQGMAGVGLAVTGTASWRVTR